MAGMKIQPINVDKNGAVDMKHLAKNVSLILYFLSFLHKIEAKDRVSILFGK
jgi:glycine cleavage system protein P-like pyridoxal-binding family